MITAIRQEGSLKEFNHFDALNENLYKHGVENTLEQLRNHKTCLRYPTSGTYQALNRLLQPMLKKEESREVRPSLDLDAFAERLLDAMDLEGNAFTDQVLDYLKKEGGDLKTQKILLALVLQMDQIKSGGLATTFKYYDLVLDRLSEFGIETEMDELRTFRAAIRARSAHTKLHDLLDPDSASKRPRSEG